MNPVPAWSEFYAAFLATRDTLEPPAEPPPGCIATNWQAMLLDRRGLKRREVAEQLHIAPTGVIRRIRYAERRWRRWLQAEWLAGRWPSPHRIPDYAPEPPIELPDFSSISAVVTGVRHSAAANICGPSISACSGDSGCCDD